VPSCYQHIKWYIRQLGLAQKVCHRLHIPGVRSESEGIRMRDSWWTKWQYNRFLFRVLLFLPVTVNPALTLLVAREDFIKQVSPTIWSISFSVPFFFSTLFVTFVFMLFRSRVSPFLPFIRFLLPLLISVGHIFLSPYSISSSPSTSSPPPRTFWSFCPFCSYFFHSTPLLVFF